MTLISDTALLKHHRVDYRPRPGVVAPRRARRAPWALMACIGVIGVNALALTLV